MNTIIKLASFLPFNPESLWGENSKNFHIVEQDVASLYVKEVDSSEIVFTDTLNETETIIHGHDRRHRLEAQGVIRLDARPLVNFWENQDSIPDCFKHEGVEPQQRYVSTSFDGTILSDLSGLLFVPILQWDRQDKEWHRPMQRLDYIWWSKTYRSAVLQKPRRWGQNAAIADILNKEPR